MKHRRTSGGAGDAVAQVKTAWRTACRALRTRLGRLAHAEPRARRVLAVVARLSLLGGLLATVAGLVLAALLLYSAVVAFVATAGIRQQVLADVPGQRVIPLCYNALPLLTETWLWEQVDSAVAPAAAAVASHTLAQATSAAASAATADELEQVPTAPPRGTAPHAGSSVSPSVHFGMRMAALKAEMVERRLHGLLATSILRVTVPHGGGACEGEADHDAEPASGSPLFNARGVYGATMQLVFVKEGRRRDVALVLETHALAMAPVPSSPPGAPDGRHLCASRVLFTRYSSTVLSTGDDPEPLLRRAHRLVIRVCFAVPLFLYDLVAPRGLVEGPFPPVDPAREVSVVINVYDGFSPSMSVQAELHAFNFSIFQSIPVHDGAASGAAPATKLRLQRMTLATSVVLEGPAYYLSAYPISSSVLLFLTLFFATLLPSLAVTGASIGFAVLQVNRRYPLLLTAWLWPKMGGKRLRRTIPAQRLHPVLRHRVPRSPWSANGSSCSVSDVGSEETTSRWNSPSDASDGGDSGHTIDDA